jgi:ATP-binding cassette subfamily C exporter for protease/lipase
MTVAAPGRPAAPSLLRQALRRPWPLYRGALLFSVVTSLLVLAPTFFMMEVYDRVLNSRNATTLAMLVMLVVGAYVVMEVLEVVRALLLAQAAQQVDDALHGPLFDAVFAANLGAGAGCANTQPFNDLRTLREFLLSPAVLAALDAPASVVFLVLVFAIGPWLGMMALVGALVQLFIGWRTERYTMRVLTEANRSAIDAQGFAAGALRNASVVEAMGMLGGLRRRWLALQQRFLHRQADASDHAGLDGAVGRLVQTLQGSLILGAACWLSLKGGLLGGGGTMIVASTLGGRVLAPLVQLVAQWRSVVHVRDACARLEQVLASAPRSARTMPLAPPKGRLVAEGVTAVAPGTQLPILRNVSFAALPGEVLVVVGPSASGKTTLARLLTGVWLAAAGKVRLDGVDVHSWNKDELGPYVGYVPQDVELFDGTLAENIARFGKVDIEQVQASVALVGLNALLASLPDGLDTRIGDDGAVLSGGQRQRVALARALYGMPRLLVLDEPNSSLDDAGDEALNHTLRRLKAAGTTIIVMSHRTSILPVADRMLVLRDGAVALFGPRDEVLAALQRSVSQAGQPGTSQAQTKPPLPATAAVAP